MQKINCKGCFGLAFVSNMFPSDDFPNYGIFVKNTADLLLQNGCEVQANISIKGRTERKLKKIFNYFSLYCKLLFGLMNSRLRIFYIHYFGFYSLPIILLLKLFNKKVIVNIHGRDLLGMYPITRSLQKKIVDWVDLFILPSKYFEDVFLKIFNFGKEKIFIYPSGGINMDVFKPMDKKRLRKSLGFSEAFSIGYVSHLNNNKGWKVFLEAVEGFKASIEDQRLNVIVVGFGQNETEFRQHLAESNIKNELIWFKKVDQKKLSELYNSMDVFIFPTRAEESLGLVGLEAMACGVPVIGSEIGCLPYYIKSGYNGFLAKAGDSNDFCAKLRAFYSLHEERRREMSLACLATANCFQGDRETKKLLERMKEL
ncbi:MAG: glycosyltransferase family 4 protein [Candidatus Rifleibacteriota bacterium]